MKKIMRIISIMLIIATMLASMTAIVGARASRYIDTHFATIAAVGSGKVDISFTINGTDTMNQIGAKTIKVYTSVGTLVKTFSYTSYSSMMTTNKVSYANKVTYSGTAGTTYYAVVTFYAEKGGSDTKTYTTASVKAR